MNRCGTSQGVLTVRNYAIHLPVQELFYNIVSIHLRVTNQYIHCLQTP